MLKPEEEGERATGLNLEPRIRVSLRPVTRLTARLCQLVHPAFLLRAFQVRVYHLQPEDLYSSCT